MKHLSVFSIIVCAFTACALVFSLYTLSETARVNDRAAALTQSIAELRDENARLEVRLNMALSLERIDDFARNTLGMRPPTAEQMVYIEP